MDIIKSLPHAVNENRFPNCLHNSSSHSNSLFHSYLQSYLFKKKREAKPKRGRVKDKSFNTHLMDGVYFALVHVPYSDESKAMVDDLAVIVGKAAGRKNKPTLSFKKALGALIHDLLALQIRNTDCYGYRRMTQGSFTGSHIPHRGFTDCIHGLRDAGYTFYEEGQKDWQGDNSFCTRSKAKPELLAYVAGYGITPANLGDHFELLPPAASIPDPIVLKTAKVYTPKGEKKGVRMQFDKTDPKAVLYAEQVNFLNAYWAKQTIVGARHYAFQRSFARGDIDGGNLDKGARLYGIGGVTLQAMPADERKAILFNGEPTVEVDVKASHITILHYLTNTTMPNRPDLYDFGDAPRAVNKAFVTATLGHTKFHKDWPEEAVRVMKDPRKGGIDLTQYDFKAVKKAAIKALPVLKGWTKSKVRWGDLQFRESEPMIAAAIELAEFYDIPAYPVHDSLRVPVSKVDIVKEVMRKQFLHYLGFEPTLEVKE